MSENSRFMDIVGTLESKLRQLVNSSPIKYKSLPANLPKRAIYLFSEANKHLYVGRTNNLRTRLRGHCNPSARHNSAAFAFKIAREMTGNMKASYSGKGSRKELIIDPEFSAAFQEAKRRLREKMEIRFINVDDPINQALLEIYVSLSLETPYNNFENH